MEAVSVSKFKATCLGIIEQVRRTGKPVLITRRGKPVAQVLPPPPKKASRFGCMAGTARELADLLQPLDESDWDALR